MEDQASRLRRLVNNDPPLPKGAKVITITSGKGGVGKSAFAVNFAIALSKHGKKVLLIDADFGLANIDVMLGVSGKHDLMDIIKGKKKIWEVMKQGHQGVHFISGGSGVQELLKLSELQIKMLLYEMKELDNFVDVILFDTGAGVNDNIMQLIGAGNETFLITTPEPTAIVDAYALVKTLHVLKEMPQVKLIINKADSVKEATDIQNSFISIAKKYMNIDITPLGYILNDPMLTKTIKMQVPITISYPKSGASMDIERIACTYLDLYYSDKQRLGLVSFFDKMLKKKSSGV